MRIACLLALGVIAVALVSGCVQEPPEAPPVTPEPEVNISPEDVLMPYFEGELPEGYNETERTAPSTEEEFKVLGETAPGEVSPEGITLNDVAQHNLESDCWMVIDGKVYDVTNWILLHPGADAILEGCGKDATELFETRPMGSGTPHSADARALLGDYFIGDLE